MDRSTNTVTFSFDKEKEKLTRETMKQIKDALIEKGYNPINQIVGYIMSGDPTYITSFKDARKLITGFERDELLEVIVGQYLEQM